MHTHMQTIRCSKCTHLLGYVSLSMMTRLIFATLPWSQVAMTDVVIMAMPIAMASPLVVISTTCARTSELKQILSHNQSSAVNASNILVL